MTVIMFSKPRYAMLLAIVFLTCITLTAQSQSKARTSPSQNANQTSDKGKVCNDIRIYGYAGI